MTIYSLDDLNLREIKALRKSLDYIPINGIDAMFIALLQNKITTQIKEIEDYIQKEETAKQEALQEAVKNDPSSDTSKRKK
jgi:hypothetical protein